MSEKSLTVTRREAAFFLAVAIVAPGAAFAASSPRLRLRVLATSDLHSYLESYDYYHDEPDDSVGLVRVATLIAAARRELPNTLLLDNGDLIQGNPLSDLVARERPPTAALPHPVIKAMNALGYDAGTPGNHDFNYGLELLNATIKGAKFPYVSANVDRVGGGTLLPPYAILKREFVDAEGVKRTVKVGVLGLVTPQIMMWDKAHLEGRVTAADILERATLYAAEIRSRGAEIVIALAHTGFDTRPAKDMDENMAYHLTSVAGLDAVISGHSHRVFPDPAYASMPDADVAHGTIHQRGTVMPGFYGSHLGVIDLDLVQVGGNWRVEGAKAEARPISRRQGGKTTALVASDPMLASVVAEDHRQTLAYVRRPIGSTTRPIHTFFSVVEPDAATAVVNEVQKQAVAIALKGGAYQDLPILSAASPFRSGGFPGPDYYTDIPAGTVAIKNIADLYLYANTLQAVSVSGADLREWLEMSAIVFRRIDPAVATPQMLVETRIPIYTFDTMSGVTYRIDLTQPPRYERNGNLVAPDAHRIRDLSFAGKPIADNARFVVATNDYRASGGGNFPGLKGASVIFASPDVMQTVIANYLQTRKEITPIVEQCWRFAPMPASVDVRFESAPKAKGYLPPNGRIRWVGPGNNGFDLYQLDLRQG